jgi:alkanesulfonate monooxygenase SsuD/methylene tetrahydromethanopterin reductase-like flavin-dependent oxidoreductase (luciferase family)
MYRQGCESGGRKAEAANWRVAKSIFVADDEATAKRYAKSAGGPYGHYFNNLHRKLISSERAELFKRDRALPDDGVTLDYILDTLVIAGTVDSVVEQILAFRETTGAFGTLLYAGHDWAEPALASRSMELMATRVMPAVNRAIGESD